VGFKIQKRGPRDDHGGEHRGTACNTQKALRGKTKWGPKSSLEFVAARRKRQGKKVKKLNPAVGQVRG